jgi:hypothetical protein
LFFLTPPPPPHLKAKWRSDITVYQQFTPLPLVLRGPSVKITRWAILVKEPVCREGVGGRVKIPIKGD